MAPSQQQKKVPQAAEISGSATKKSSTIKAATIINAKQKHHQKIAYDQHRHAIEQNTTLTRYALPIASAWEGFPSHATQYIRNQTTN